MNILFHPKTNLVTFTPSRHVTNASDASDAEDSRSRNASMEQMNALQTLHLIVHNSRDQHKVVLGPFSGPSSGVSTLS